MNKMIYFDLSHKNKVLGHIDKYWDTFEIFKEKRSYNDLGSADEMKGDQGNVCYSR